MTADQMRGVFNLILGSWASQRQRMTDDDVAAMAEAYHEGLSDLDHDLARKAVIRCQRTSVFIPAVATIREAAGIIKFGHGRVGGEAWGEVKKLQTYRTTEGHLRVLRDQLGVLYFDPLVLKVCDAMGWLRSRTITRFGRDIDEWCVTTGENEAADRARFFETYGELREEAIEDARSNDGLAPGQTLQALPASIAPRIALEEATPARLLTSGERSAARQDLRALIDESPALKALGIKLPELAKGQP